MPQRRDKRQHRRDAYDTEIVRNATTFTAVRWAPRGQSQRFEFSTLPEAIGAANEMRDEYGRPAMIYAVTAEGREAHLSEALWPRWLEISRGAHK